MGWWSITHDIQTTECIENSNSYTNPGSIQVDGYKGGRDGEVVDEGVKLQHEPELVGGGNEADEEVDHEEDVEGEVDLLKPVLAPGHTLLNSIIAGWIC